MEDHENLIEKIRQILGGSPGKLKILEQKIDIDLQVEYYECSLRVREERDEKWALDHMKYLHEPGTSSEAKKEIMARLASMNRVECYRAIESFMQEATEPLLSWAILSLNESRMLLESRLLDENQVFISTGLGGRDDKLRYFVVLMSRTRVELTPVQQRVIQNEFEYILNKFEGAVEEIEFSGYLAAILFLLPMKHSLKSLFKEAIDECNRYGHFLNDDFIVTNVRALSFAEIEEFLERKGERN